MNEHEFCERLLYEERVAVTLGTSFSYEGEGRFRSFLRFDSRIHDKGI